MSGAEGGTGNNDRNNGLVLCFLKSITYTSGITKSWKLTVAAAVFCFDVADTPISPDPHITA